MNSLNINMNMNKNKNKNSNDMKSYFTKLADFNATLKGSMPLKSEGGNDFHTCY